MVANAVFQGNSASVPDSASGNPQACSECGLNSIDRNVGKPLNSLFKMAVLAGVESAVRLHISRGDDLNARDGSGMTPLMLAASKNKSAICVLLLSSGADLHLQAPNGHDAAAFARDAGATDALAVFESLASKPEPENEAIPAAVSQGVDDRKVAEELSRRERDEAPALDDGEEITDLSGWEAEENRPAPVADNSLVEAATASFACMSSHIPFDHSEGWDDFDVFLPDAAMPLPKVGQQEAREKTSRILRRALREGSVPEREIFELFETEVESSNESDETLLKTVLADIGAETDERLEISDGHDYWPAMPGDDDEVAEALLHFEDLRAGRNAPMRHYLRDVQKASKLLTAAEEIALAKSMEVGLLAAVDILATWPAGMVAFVAAAEQVRSGKVEVDLISELAEDASEPFQAPVEENVDDPAYDELHDAAPGIGDTSFWDRMNAVKRFSQYAGTGGADEAQLQKVLHAAKLSPAFLVRVADLCKMESCQFAVAFRTSLGNHVKAKERLIRANLRLVIAFVKRYQAFGLPYDDLVQEGNFGLMKAAERFEWRKGFRFTTYATWWIRQRASRAIADTAHTIRTPVHLHESILRMEKEAEMIERLTGQAPSAQVLAAKLSMSREKVESLQARLHEPVSLFEPDASGLAPADWTVEDSLVVDPYALAERSSLLANLDRMLAELPAKAAEMMALRFGLDGNGHRTLEEIGVHFGVTRERIRQMEASTLKFLAHPIRSDGLRTFLDGDAAVPKLVMASSPIHVPAPFQARKKRKPREVKEVESQSVEGFDGPTVAKVHAEAGYRPAYMNKGASPTERAIAMAKAAGAHVVDGRDRGDEVIVVLHSEESQLRVVIRTLLNVGFERYAEMEFRK